MPVEGNWARQQVPLRRLTTRERVAMVVGGAVVAAGLIVLLLVVVLASGSSKPRAGCIDVTAGSTMGAGRVHACGAAAVRVCRTEAVGNSPLAQALRRQCAQIP
jgi:hypothetical protein